MKLIISILFLAMITLSACAGNLAQVQNSAAEEYTEATIHIKDFTLKFRERWKIEAGVIFGYVVNSSIKIPPDIKMSLETLNCLAGVRMSEYEDIPGIQSLGLSDCEKPLGEDLDDFEIGYLYGNRTFAIATASYKAIKAFLGFVAPDLILVGGEL